MSGRFEYLLKNSILAMTIFSTIYKHKKTEESYVIYSENDIIKVIEEYKYNDEGHFIGIVDNGIFLPNNINTK